MAIDALLVLTLPIAASGFSSTNSTTCFARGYPVTWRDTKCADFLDGAVTNVRDNW